MSFAIGSWAGRRPGLGGDVTVTGATGGATAAGGRSCCLVSPPEGGHVASLMQPGQDVLH